MYKTGISWIPLPILCSCFAAAEQTASKPCIGICVPKGAQASVIIYSLVETAKENGLDPYRYLTWLMREAPKLDLGAEEQIAGLLPANAPEECRVIKGV